MEFLKKTWGIWLGVVIVVGFVVLIVLTGAQVRQGGVAIEVEPISATDHVFGNPQAKAVLIEYGDYQCPACAIYEQLVSQLTKEFPNDLAVVFRHFPLRSLHANADESAQAAEAAGLQGKFWEMHEKLYANQTDWEKLPDPRAMFTGYADELGLDKTKFVLDMNSADVKSKIDAAVNKAQSMGLSGTPTFFLNGKQLLDNPRGYEAFKALVQAEISK